MEIVHWDQKKKKLFLFVYTCLLKQNRNFVNAISELSLLSSLK
jgi:hypothetical protein